MTLREKSLEFTKFDNDLSGIETLYNYNADVQIMIMSL